MKKFLILLVLCFAIKVHAQTLDDIQGSINNQWNIFNQNHSPVCSIATTTILKLGSNNLSVKCLQRLLNGNPDTLVSTGTTAGATGYETTYFGTLTRDAVKKHQTLYGFLVTGIADATTTESIRTLSVEAVNITEVVNAYQGVLDALIKINHD